MLLKLKESIIARGEHYAPPAVIDTEVLKISDAEALVLVRRGTAEHHDPELVVQAPPEGAPVVTKIETIHKPADDSGAGGDAELVEGRLAGLDDMKKDELVKLGTEMGLEVAGKTKAELIDLIKAQPVFAEKAEGSQE